jgi:hypothetical protein
MDFSNKNNQRSWSELFYRNFVDDDLASTFSIASRNRIAINRAQALVRSNVLTAITAWKVDEPRVTFAAEVNMPGMLQGPNPLDPDPQQDIAPASVLLQLNSADATRQYLMRGIADSDVVDGQFNPLGLARGQYNLWFRTITVEQLRIRFSNFAAIGLIDKIENGTITTISGVPATGEGALLAIRTEIAGGGKPVATRTRLRADVALNATELEVTWPFGNCDGGDVRRVVYGYSLITGYAQRIPARTRKTGGPKSKFRGRR